jgi:hypothetical protein
LLELLEDDIELVDALPLLRAARSEGPYLYNSADTHWAPSAMRLVAEEVARRLARYDFVAKARCSNPIVATLDGPYSSFGPDRVGEALVQNGWLALSAEQRRRAAGAEVRSNRNVVTANGKIPRDDPNSPVMLVGDSYGINFREELIRELNLLTNNRFAGGQTTEAFCDFLREPGLLDHTRVVIWITTEQHMTQFKPLPLPIADALVSSK